MAVAAVTVGRREYASGLYWENSPGGSIAKAAIESARSPGNAASFYCVRQGNKTGRIPQFGLSQSVDEHKPGMPSLAGCLANQQPGSWAGAFRLREGTSIIVIRDDLIVPDGDQFYLDENEARERLLQEMALGGLQRVYAPETWGVPGADNLPLSLLLNDRTDVKLKTISISSKSILLIAGIFIGLLLLLGIGWYIQRQNEIAEQEEQARLEAYKRAQLEAEKMAPGFIRTVPQYPLPERLWELEPKPLAVVHACHEALSKVAINFTGWRIMNISCTANALSINLNRTVGYASAPANWLIDETGKMASFSVQINKMRPRGAEALKDGEFITARYLNQNWPGDLLSVPDDPPPPPPPDFKGEWNPPPPLWKKRSFTLTVPILPWTLDSFFENLPGVIVKSLTFSPTGSNQGVWSIEGVIYENRR